MRQMRTEGNYNRGYEDLIAAMNKGKNERFGRYVS